MSHFTNEDFKKFADQFKTLLTFLEKLNERHQVFGKMHDRLFTMQREQCTNDEDNMQYLEHNEQAYHDEVFNTEKQIDYPKPLKNFIYLKRKMDLKHRKLITQVRGVLKLRQFENECIEPYELRNVFIMNQFLPYDTFYPA